jgi:hypothetical protein
MRMTASWFRSARIDRIQGCGAISAPNGEMHRLIVSGQFLAAIRPRGRAIPPGRQFLGGVDAQPRRLGAARAAHTRFLRKTLSRRGDQRDQREARRGTGAVRSPVASTEWSLSEPQRKECLRRVSFAPPRRPVGTFFSAPDQRSETRRKWASPAICPNHPPRPLSPFRAIFRLSRPTFSGATELRPFWYGY